MAIVSCKLVFLFQDFSYSVAKTHDHTQPANVACLMMFLWSEYAHFHRFFAASIHVVFQTWQGSQDIFRIHATYRKSYVRDVVFLHLCFGLIAQARTTSAHCMQGESLAKCPKQDIVPAVDKVLQDRIEKTGVADIDEAGDLAWRRWQVPSQLQRLLVCILR